MTKTAWCYLGLSVACLVGTRAVSSEAPLFGALLLGAGLFAIMGIVVFLWALENTH